MVIFHSCVNVYQRVTISFWVLTVPYLNHVWTWTDWNWAKQISPVTWVQALEEYEMSWYTPRKNITISELLLGRPWNVTYVFPPKTINWQQTAFVLIVSYYLGHLCRVKSNTFWHPRHPMASHVKATETSHPYWVHRESHHDRVTIPWKSMEHDEIHRVHHI